MSAKPKLLFVGDFIAPTGFNKVNVNILKRVKDDWRLYILGINYYGDPHPLQKEFQIYPAASGGDAFGVGRIASLVKAIKPDLLVMHQDAWNIRLYLEALKFENVKRPKTIVWCPPDAPNQSAGGQLNGIEMLLTPTKFGQTELIVGGYEGPTKVLPYGVDTDLYKPKDKKEARRNAYFTPEMMDGFVFGRADRNAQRKRYDLTIMYWAEWWDGAGRPEDAYLYLHCAMQDVGWDLPQLAKYYGIEQRVRYTAKDLNPGRLIPESQLPDILNSWDVHFSTTMGEGFGLVALESAACQVAQCVPRNSAYEEWLWRAARFTEAYIKLAMSGGGINTLGSIVDRESCVTALDHLYRERAHTTDYAIKAYNVATQQKYQWSNIANEFNRICKEVIG